MPGTWVLQVASLLMPATHLRAGSPTDKPSVNLSWPPDRDPCYELNSVPPNPYVNFANPRTSECDVFGDKAFNRGNSIKMRSLGWAVIQHDWCP